VKAFLWCSLGGGIGRSLFGAKKGLLALIRLEDGRWKMEDGRWKMEDGRWKMEDGDYYNTAKLYYNKSEIRSSPTGFQSDCNTPRL